MKNRIKIITVIMLLGCLISANSYSQDKIAQSGLQFLSVVSDAQAASLAEATTGLQFGSSSLFFNPAGMAEMTSFIDMSASHNQWIADITHYSFSFAIKPFSGNYGVVGFTVQSVDYGDFYGTRVNEANPQGYDDTGIFSLNALAVGVGYAKQLTDRFSVGGQVRYVHQDLGTSYIASNVRTDPSDPTGTRRIADTSTTSNKLSPLVFDFGTQFRTGLKSLVFGMSVRNFSGELKYAEEDFEAPLVFTLGVAMNVMDLAGDLPFNQSLYVSVDASHYRDYPEQVKVGLDYRIMNLLSLRGGYASASGEASAFSFGLGITHYGFSFDYAYTPFGVFNNVQRLTARFSL